MWAKCSPFYWNCFIIQPARQNLHVKTFLRRKRKLACCRVVPLLYRVGFLRGNYKEKYPIPPHPFQICIDYRV